MIHTLLPPSLAKETKASRESARKLEKGGERRKEFASLPTCYYHPRLLFPTGHGLSPDSVPMSVLSLLRSFVRWEMVVGATVLSPWTMATPAPLYSWPIPILTPRFYPTGGFWLSSSSHFLLFALIPLYLLVGWLLPRQILSPEERSVQNRSRELKPRALLRALRPSPPLQGTPAEQLRRESRWSMLPGSTAQRYRRWGRPPQRHWRVLQAAAHDSAATRTSSENGPGSVSMPVLSHARKPSLFSELAGCQLVRLGDW